jgi:hypothetical protein
LRKSASVIISAVGSNPLVKGVQRPTEFP